jgi:hypothetical protein
MRDINKHGQNTHLTVLSPNKRVSGFVPVGHFAQIRPIGRTSDTHQPLAEMIRRRFICSEKI